jgi:hypothetical protein
MGGVGGWIVYSAYQYKHTMLPTQSALSRASTIGWIGLGAMGKSLYLCQYGPSKAEQS